MGLGMALIIELEIFRLALKMTHCRLHSRRRNIIIRKITAGEVESAMKLAERFLHHCIEDTMKEDISTNDGVNFEKFLGKLIQGISR